MSLYFGRGSFFWFKLGIWGFQAGQKYKKVRRRFKASPNLFVFLPRLEPFCEFNHLNAIMASMTESQHPFSWQAIGRIILALLAVFLIWQSISVFVVILIALVIAASLYPIAKRMNRKIPMILSITLVILLLLLPLAALIAITSLSFSNQFPQVITALTPLLAKFHITSDMIQSTNIINYFNSNLGTFLNSTKEVGLAILAVFTTIFLTFYFMFDAERLFTLFVEVFPSNEQKNIRKLSEEIALVIGQYIRGNLFISLICILIIYGGLAILHIPFALPIAIFTGIMDLLPVIGPILGALPALLLGFAISPEIGIFVLVLYVAYKELEDFIIGPLIYNKTLKLSPALVFLSVVIGAGVFGIIGAFLALPVAASIPVIIRYKDHLVNKDEVTETIDVNVSIKND